MKFIVRRHVVGAVASRSSSRILNLNFHAKTSFINIKILPESEILDDNKECRICFCDDGNRKSLNRETEASPFRLGPC